MHRYWSLGTGVLLVTVAALLLGTFWGALPWFVLLPVYAALTLVGVANLAAWAGRPARVRREWSTVEPLTYFALALVFVVGAFSYLQDPGSEFSYLLAAVFGVAAGYQVWFGVASVRGETENPWAEE